MMRSWNDYKDYVKRIDPEGKKDIEEIEAFAEIISAIIEQRNSKGLSQRELASECGIPQSSVARMESFATIPKLDTLIKVMHQLGLKLTVIASA